MCFWKLLLQFAWEFSSKLFSAWSGFHHHHHHHYRHPHSSWWTHIANLKFSISFLHILWICMCVLNKTLLNSSRHKNEKFHWNSSGFLTHFSLLWDFFSLYLNGNLMLNFNYHFFSAPHCCYHCECLSINFCAFSLLFHSYERMYEDYKKILQN